MHLHFRRIQDQEKELSHTVRDALRRGANSGTAELANASAWEISTTMQGRLKTIKTIRLNRSSTAAADAAVSTRLVHQARRREDMDLIALKLDQMRETTYLSGTIFSFSYELLALVRKIVIQVVVMMTTSAPRFGSVLVSLVILFFAVLFASVR